MKIFMTPKRCIVTIILCSAVTGELEYTWLEHNNYYDCIVGISFDGKPISSGVLVHFRHVWTAANPLERYVHRFDRIRVHVVNGDFDKVRELELDYINGNQFGRMGNNRIPVGFDGIHSPIHDIVCLTLKYVNSVKSFRTQYPYEKRIPFYTQTPPMTYNHKQFTKIPGGPLEAKGWSYAGFGFVDRRHVKENVQMELIEYFHEDVLVDCDEWIPKEWGNFICLLNVDSFVGISAGAGLFFNDTLYDLGSYSVAKGNESILVFTDIRIYRWGPIKCNVAKGGELYRDDYVIPYH